MHLNGRQFVAAPRRNDFLERVNLVVGQESPEVEEHYYRMHGRYLNGFSGAEEQWQQMRRYDVTPELFAANESDDSAGAGIFDDPHVATVHNEMGVFADHPALPGYIKRTLPFLISPEVSDAPAGAGVVEVPGGGMWAVESMGVPTRFPGVPASRPAFERPGRSSQLNPYVLQTAPDPQWPYALQDPSQPSSVDTSGTFVPGVGLGLDPEAKPPGFWTYALVGAGVGAALAMVLHATNMKKGRI